MKKIGLFGGSFDPIHFGHLNLAIALMEQHQLDQILFCPAAVSPLKSDALPHAAKEQRREMVRLSLIPFPSFQLLDWELEREGPSYTIDTVRALLKQGSALHLILGEDALQQMPQWKDYEELLSLAPPLIGSRFNALPSLEERIRRGVTRIPVMEISSTSIRERLRKKKNCHHLVPALALDYIAENHIYSSTK